MLKPIRLAEQIPAAALCHGHDVQALTPADFEHARIQRMPMLKHLWDARDDFAVWHWHALDAQ